jgi:hypothetical protein
VTGVDPKQPVVLVYALCASGAATRWHTIVNAPKRVPGALALASQQPAPLTQAALMLALRTFLRGGAMPSNDIILLNSILQKNKPLYGTRDDESEYFELFSIDSVLKNYELSLDELEDGWVDESNDGGIDGLYVFVDGIFLSDQFETKHVRQEPHIEVYILTVKSADKFTQAPVVSLITSLGELFNFQLDTLWRTPTRLSFLRCASALGRPTST